MHTIWASLAAKSTGPGHAGFAREQSAKYLQLHDDTESRFSAKGEPRLVKITELTLVQTVREFRKQELGWLEELARVKSG